LLDPKGDQVSRYDKMHLVPFGEYVPFKRLLFFAESLTRQVGDFVPGTEYTIANGQMKEVISSNRTEA